MPTTPRDFWPEHYIAIGGCDVGEDKRVVDSVGTSLNFHRLVKRTRILVPSGLPELYSFVTIIEVLERGGR